PFIVSMFTLILMMSVLTTCATVWRIRKVQNRLKHREISTVSSPLSGAIRVLIETGLMY
ncbi:hypothetical protein P691DRAFT_633900, partial [Macrolepiota fuliginosa MF-IS2]